MPEAIPVHKARLVVGALALLYSAGHLAWYGATPLGGYPVLDGREILELARLMASGELPAEPFYRAPLYSALIAVGIELGVADAALPDLARLINLVAHLISTLLVFELARRMWGQTRAGLLGGVLYALYPVAVHFAGDPLDITVATTLALGATLAIWRAHERLSWQLAMLSAMLLALAALARPNFLAALGAVLLWLGWLALRDRGNWRLLAGVAVGAALVLGSMGFINLRLGNEFRLLPWQGGHAFFDSNGPGANGLFYSHSIDIPDLVPGNNPARAEAQILYCRDRDCSGPLDIDDFQTYWRTRALEHITAHPGAFSRLLGEKIFYLVNNYEQYNNKTYWIHKERAPWLRWNPLCWSLVLALAAGALWLPLPARARWLLLLLGLSYAATLLIYLVSARFRVPLVGWLCVLAGGWALAFAGSQALAGRRRALALGTAVLAGALALLPIVSTLREGTITEDWMLLSSAALAAGRPDESEEWAQRVLARLPDRNTAHAMVCSARLHLWEQAPASTLPPRAWLEASLLHCAAGAEGSHRSAYNAAFFLSALCRRAEGVALWNGLRDSALVGELARSALAAVGQSVAVPADANVGLLKLQQSPIADRTPGQQSILAAVLGQQCAPAGGSTL